MTSIRTAQDSRWGETFDRLKAMTREGRYEEVEAEARALAALPRRPWRRRPPHWEARVLATGAAVMHGRVAEALDELDTLIAELEPVGLNSRMLRLIARSSRVAALSGLRRYAEAETEANGVLRELNQIAHRAPVSALEINTLGHLAAVLYGLERHEEAEAVARGNLTRANGSAVAVLHATLARALNGQGRHEEALTEVRRDDVPQPPRYAAGYLDLVTAEALNGLGRREEAATSARRALTDCERELHPDHPRTPEARALLARVTGEKEDPGE
ncbi:tetratricopeptide repeat protein [Streptomyces coelicoflavus]|uniref:tetratricopeptide repeat protein n=1 Tax=Streptomyces TaxID=1883 RepID=UPI001D17A2AF|nr:MULTISPECIES: tetratricopeptide repeat protein [Streptomyces]MCX5035024.1 tetratricopeptide repeat protein [Streptomyces coelicoflavus]